MDKWLKHGVIEKSCSLWNLGLVSAPKKGGTIRWCEDYRALNDMFVHRTYIPYYSCAQASRPGTPCCSPPPLTHLASCQPTSPRVCTGSTQDKKKRREISIISPYLTKLAVDILQSQIHN
jgi:hypothetical protein